MTETGMTPSPNPVPPGPPPPPPPRSSPSRIKTRDEVVDRLIRSELNNKDRGINHDIYERRLLAPSYPGFKYVPHCIYFYYVRLDADGKLRIDHYFYANGPKKKPLKWLPIPYEDVPKIMKRLAKNGRPSRRKNPRLEYGDTFEDVIWNRRSYVGIYFDEANWSFHKRGSGKSAIVCNVSNGGQPNSSFFDAKDLIFTMKSKKTGKKTKRSAIFFVNHMKKDDDGYDAGEAELNYKFDIYMKVKYAKTDYAVMTLVLDPGGTNQGPPEQP